MMMQRLVRMVHVVVLGAALSLAACSKSVEGESKRWTANTARVSELAATYPGLRPALEARKGEAQKLHDAADGLDGDAKIDKLAAANAAIMKGFVGDLDGLDDKIKALREKRVEAAARAGDDSSRLAAKVAAEDAQKALDRADAALKAGASDEASAAAILKKVRGDLDTAAAALDKVLAVDKEKKSEADAAKKAEVDAKQAEVDAKAAADAAAAAAVAPWKCGHCDTENPHDEANCKSCGAPRPSDDKKAAPAAK